MESNITFGDVEALQEALRGGVMETENELRFGDAQALEKALSGSVIGNARVAAVEAARDIRDHAPELKAVAATVLVSAGVVFPMAQAATANAAPRPFTSLRSLAIEAPVVSPRHTPKQLVKALQKTLAPVSASTSGRVVTRELFKGDTIWHESQTIVGPNNQKIANETRIAMRLSGVQTEAQAEDLAVGTKVTLPLKGNSEVPSVAPQPSAEHSSPPVTLAPKVKIPESSGGTIFKSSLPKAETPDTKPAVPPTTESKPQAPPVIKAQPAPTQPASQAVTTPTASAPEYAVPTGPAPQYIVSVTPGTTPQVTPPSAEWPVNGIDTNMNPTTSASPAETAATDAEIAAAQAHAVKAKSPSHHTGNHTVTIHHKVKTHHSKTASPSAGTSGNSAGTPNTTLRPTTISKHAHHTGKHPLADNHHRLKVEPLPAAHPGQAKATPLPAAHSHQVKVHPIANSSHTLECDKNVIHPLIGKLVQEKVIDFFMICNDDSLAAATGYEANLMHESTLDPTRIETTAVTGGNSTSPYAAGKYGWGLAQWTPGADVLSAAADYAINTPIQDLQTQLEIIAAQSNGHSPTGYADLNGVIKDYTSSTAAAAMVDQNFEGPLDGGNEGAREADARASAEDFGAAALRALHHSKTHSTATAKHHHARPEPKPHVEQPQPQQSSATQTPPAASSNSTPASTTAPAATPPASQTPTTPVATNATGPSGPSGEVSTTPSTPTTGSSGNTGPITVSAPTAPGFPTIATTTPQLETGNSTPASADTSGNSSSQSNTSGNAANQATPQNGGNSNQSNSPESTTDNSEQIAKQILNNKNISLTGTDVEQDIQDAANGQPGTAGVPTAEPILNLINTLGEGHTVSISAIQSGGIGHCLDAAGVSQPKADCPDDPHYNGDAVDIYEFDGQPVTGRDVASLAIMKLAFPVLPSGSGFGQDNCGPEYSTSTSLPNGDITFSDSCTHLHVQVPAGTA